MILRGDLLISGRHSIDFRIESKVYNYMDVKLCIGVRTGHRVRTITEKATTR